MPQAQRSQTNRLLGYPDDARLLIINADDFGRAHASNAGTVRAFVEGVVRSTTLMVPCPWALHAMQLLAEHPGLAFGVHLTLISEERLYRWRPLTAKNQVPSLVDAAGFFVGEDDIPGFLAQVNLAEVEVEFRAQIETVLAAALTPTHLDFHCLANGGRADIFALTVRLAREYGLAVRVSGRATGDALRRQGLPTNEHEVLDSYRVDIAGKQAWLARALQDLPIGLTEWAVHPALETPEMHAIEPQSWQVRSTDLAFLLSQTTREILVQEGIVLLSYEPLQRVWQEEYIRTR